MTDPRSTERHETSAGPRDVRWHHNPVERRDRWDRLGLSGMTVWFTGLSGSGKSTTAAALAEQLHHEGIATYILDGDNLRHGLNADLGFGDDDRVENIRRIGHVARLMADAGFVVLVPVISPFRAGRDTVRAAHHAESLPFVEVYMDTPLEVCAERDPKGLYARARAGELTNLTGVDSPYERPDDPDLTLHPAMGGPADLARVAFDAIVRIRSDIS